MSWRWNLFPISVLHVPSPMHLKCLLQSHSLLCAKNAARKDCSLLWSTSKPRSLHSIFTIEYRFLWKGQFIFKSWMDNLKVIYSWLIFRDQKKIQHKNISQIYWTSLWLGLDWIFIHSVLTIFWFWTSQWTVTGHGELCNSATLIEMIYFYGRTASLR